MPKVRRSGARRVEVLPWGEVDGVPVALVTLQAGVLCARVCSFGATLVGVELPPGRADPGGLRRDVVCGRDALDAGPGGGYVGAHPYLGGTVGRVANRIAGARFDLDGREVRLPANEGSHHLHGGLRGFDRRPWRWVVLEDPRVAAVRFSYVSPDGEEGYPGEVRVALEVRLDASGVLSFATRATTDRPTPLALAHHPYVNLAGHAAGSVREHLLEVSATHYLPTDAAGVPTGEIRPVEGTRYDFRTAKEIGSDLDTPTIREPRGGYDVAYLIDGAQGTLRTAARLREPVGGLELELRTTQRSLQLYTANDVLDVPGKESALYGRFGAVALEAQAPPDAVHHPAFGDVVLRPGQVYAQRSEYRFGGW